MDGAGHCVWCLVARSAPAGQRRWEAPDEEDSEAPEPGGVRNALRVLRMRYDMVDVEPPPAPQES